MVLHLIEMTQLESLAMQLMELVSDSKHTIPSPLMSVELTLVGEKESLTYFMSCDGQSSVKVKSSQ